MQSKLFISLTVLPVLIYFAGYPNKVTSISAIIDSTGLPPVETKAPNSDYKPAFGGQTRIAGAKTKTPYQVEKISEKLGHPFAIAAMPDGRLMVTIKSGFMEIHDANGKFVKKITKSH